MLLALLVVPLFVGFLCLLLPKIFAKGISYAGFFINIFVVFLLGQAFSANSTWLLEESYQWVPSWSINLHLAVDSLAYWLVLLTEFLFLCAAFIAKKEGKFLACLNWATFGVLGLFLSANTLFFFIFWEVALLPIYWMLIRSEDGMTLAQSLRFIIITQVSGLFLLMGILALSFCHWQQSGNFTFEYTELLKNALAPEAQLWVLLLFLGAFLIKLPAVPFHGWMPALFSKGPASAIMVAILVKSSIFGILRFSWPMLSDASAVLSVPMVWVGAISLIYGAILAFSQSEPKRVMAYATLSHAGLLLMGVFSESFYGTLILLVASALSTAAILMILESRSLNSFALSGLWHSHPKMSLMLLTMLLATMGFPIFGNFVGEWLILWSIFSIDTVLAIVASLGIVLGAAYGLRVFQRLCFGQETKASFPDLKPQEMGMLLAISFMIIGFGLMPSIFLEKSEASLTSLNEFGESL
jgi:NADH-quinone oxidoreductase subunit M